MPAYYNEHDRFAAQWLRELMADGLIAPGVVDERSIVDVRPSDLGGYDQHHFFAGIGVWSLAMRLAGWPDDRPIWTASCPCQPFSAAGKGGGFDDERHMWPYLYWLIAQHRPTVIVGEQVSSDDGLAWLDVVQADLDQADYTSGALDSCAAGLGAPHIRQRLYWMAHTERDGGRSDQSRRESERRAADGRYGRPGEPVRMGVAASGRLERQRDQSAHGVIVSAGAFTRGVADARPERQHEHAQRDGPALAGIEDDPPCGHDARGRGFDHRPGPTNGLWRNADWLGCRDGKWRPVEPGSFPLAATRTVRNRVGTLRGAGNALNVAQAQAFLEAVQSVI